MLKLKGSVFKMKIGYVGLGKMGLAMSQRLISRRHKVVGFDVNSKARKNAQKIGVETIENLSEFKEKLEKPRFVWVMVPHGKIVDSVIDELSNELEEGDIIVDGGNSYYKNTVKRAKKLKQKNIFLLDCGTSGGLKGAKNGASLMIGGDKKAFLKFEEIFKDLAAEKGYGYFGKSGAGHFVKMVHNGIEYALMQSYGEGMELLAKNKEFEIDLRLAAQVWNNGSVIRSWLCELMEEALSEDPKLEKISDEIGGGSTGKWTTQLALDQEIPTPLIAMALMLRYKSRQKNSFSGKIAAILRNKFGGHTVKKK